MGSKLKFAVTRYTVSDPRIPAPIRAAVVADLHDRAWEPVRDALLSEAPDVILAPGDLFDTAQKTARAEAFLAFAAGFRPTFFSLGNHDIRSLDLDAIFRISEHTGAVLLQNSAVSFRGIALGGLATGYTHGSRQHRLGLPAAPDTAFLARFEREEGFHLLLSHHPEYFDKYIAPRKIELTLSGHAHGGQWSIGRHGLFAPGQGLFPRYTAGMYHGRLLVSRGLCETHRYRLRIGNPRELLMLTLTPGESQKTGRPRNAKPL